MALPAPTTPCPPISGAPSIRCGRELPTFAPVLTGSNGAATRSWALSVRAWAHATRLSLQHMTRALASMSSTTHRQRSHARRTAQRVAGDQPDRLFRQVPALAEKIADDLRPLRPHLSAGVLQANGKRISHSRPGHYRQGTALRTLF